ncbi:rhodanese family protein [Acinetobacter sp. c2-A9]|uniref:rhodanese family protein n=1 Tax=Acinetobacter sp. c2-A9 TaxID=3342802 RepID=UPI0035BAD6D0
MSIQTISTQDAVKLLQQGQSKAVLVDIRGDDEHRRERIDGAISQPLDKLMCNALDGKAQHADTVIFHCKSGMRTEQAKQILADKCPNQTVYILQNGLDGWKNAGQTTLLDHSQPIDIMRQVQIIAGSLVLLGVILGLTVNTAFFGLSAFVGAGLAFAGITGFCGMAKLLKFMPWNKA